MNFKKIYLVIFLLFIFSCSFVNDDYGYKTSYYIFSILKVGEESIKVIVDSTLSIDDSLNSENNFIHDAVVKIDGQTAFLETLNLDTSNNDYRYVYRIKMDILEDKDYEIEVKIDNDLYYARTKTPKKIFFYNLNDSDFVKLDSNFKVAWNPSGVGFYFLEIYQKDEYGSFHLFSTGIMDDTTINLFPLSYLFPDSGLFDFYIISYDSSFYKYSIDQDYSSFDKAYGLFGSISVDYAKDLTIVK